LAGRSPIAPHEKKSLIILSLILAIPILLFAFGNHSFQSAPYPLPNSPMIAYRITGQEGDLRFFANDPNSIQGYAIIQRQMISDSQLQNDVINALNSRLVYGSDNIRCFEPGIAFRLGEGPNAIDVLICLTCRHIYFFRGGEVAYRNLNSAGVVRIEDLYGRLFSGHTPDGPNEDADRITAARDQERQKREEQLLDAATSRPATQPTP
jgi:hypothetical protein